MEAQNVKERETGSARMGIERQPASQQVDTAYLSPSGAGAHLDVRAKAIRFVPSPRNPPPFAFLRRVNLAGSAGAGRQIFIDVFECVATQLEASFNMSNTMQPNIRAALVVVCQLGSLTFGFLSKIKKAGRIRTSTAGDLHGFQMAAF